MSCRYTLDVLIAGEDAPFDRRRHLVETCLIVFGSLAVALAFPTGAEKIFAVTGTLVRLCRLSRACELSACEPALFKVIVASGHLTCLRSCSMPLRNCADPPMGATRQKGAMKS